MSGSRETFREWTAFKSHRATNARGNTDLWVGVVGDDVIGRFPTKDAAIDELLKLKSDLSDCAVFHWDMEPAELSVCLVFGT